MESHPGSPRPHGICLKLGVNSRLNECEGENDGEISKGVHAPLSKHLEGLFLGEVLCK